MHKNVLRTLCTQFFLRTEANLIASLKAIRYGRCELWCLEPAVYLCWERYGRCELWCLKLAVYLCRLFNERFEVAKGLFHVFTVACSGVGLGDDGGVAVLAAPCSLQAAQAPLREHAALPLQGAADDVAQSIPTFRKTKIINKQETWLKRNW